MLRLYRKALAAILTLGVALSTSGCSGNAARAGNQALDTASDVLGACRSIPEPEKLGLHEWHTQMLERYIECSITHALCTKGLLE